MPIPGPLKEITLPDKKFRVLTLMNGWDTSHDFFQPIRDEWKSKYPEGTSIINDFTESTVGGAPQLKFGRPTLKSLSSINKPAFPLKQRSSKQTDPKVMAMLYAQAVQRIKDDNEFKINFLAEVREDLGIYDYLYKFVCGPAVPELNPCTLEESWIYTSKDDPYDDLDYEPSKRRRVEPSFVGGDRSRRTRKLSPTAQEALRQATVLAEEAWNEVQGWDNSVRNYLQDSMPWRQAMNEAMVANGCKLLTYQEFATNQGLQDDGSKETFVQLQIRNPKTHIVHRRFVKQYNKMKIEGYIKKQWLSTGVFDESNPIHAEWKNGESKRKSPVLTNQQTTNLKELHKKLMQQWCKLVYPNHNGDNGPPAELEGWEKHVYQKMWNGNPSDSILFDQFKRNQPNQVTNDNLGKLSSVVQSALGNGYVINNAAPFQKYLGNYKSNPKLFLKNDKTQYNCVMVSVIDPQSQCPKFSGAHKGNPSGTLKVQSEDKNSSVQIVYQGSGASPFIEYTLTINGIEKIKYKLDLKPDNLSYALQISSVIQPMMEVISKAGKDLDTLNTLEDTDIQNIMKIATGKLCGDFGQELFAVEQIVYGALPIVFMSNDRPSAIRFLDMIESVRGRLQGQRFWGGFLGKTNHLIVSDSNNKKRKGSKQAKQKSSNRRNLKTKKKKYKKTSKKKSKKK